MIGWKEIGRSHMENNNKKTDDVIMDKKYKVKVLEPVNTITQRYESHKTGTLKVYQSKHWKQAELPLTQDEILLSKIKHIRRT